MAALTGAVVVPVAEQQMLKNHGLDLGIGTLLVAEFVAGIVHAAGKNLRNKDYVFAVGRPDGSIGFRGDAGNLLCRASWGTRRRIKAADPNLRATFRCTQVEIALSIGRPVPAGLTGSSARELAGNTA